MKTIRLFAIGNSLAENPLTYLPELARDSGEVSFEIGRALIGGCPLEKHWNLAEYTRVFPEHKTYQFSYAPGAPQLNLQEGLVRASWDWVTLNHASIPGPWRETYQPWLANLCGLVRSLAPQARLALNMTWAYREDAPYLVEHGLTSETMFELLRANYRHFGTELGCPVIPTGESIQEFRRLPGRQFTFPDRDFDYHRAKPPHLPRQDHSLSVGWHWAALDTAEGIPELRLDYNHLNPTGLYLASCTWFESLTGLDVRRLRFKPLEIDESLAAQVREVAHEVCARYASHH